MRRSFVYLFFLTLILGMTGCGPAPEAESKLPNIILCMADDQGWGDMAYNGHPVLQTPNFDALAAEALRFDHFYAAHPVCSPTRGSVMTGRNPNRFGCFRWGRILRPQENSIAEVLKEAGYVTGHFGKWHLGSVRIGSPVNPGNNGFDEWLSAPNFFDNDPILSREGIAVQTEGESSMVTVDAALEFIHKHEGKDKPYLAVVWFGSPHGPHQAIEEDGNLYADQTEKLKNFYGEVTGMDRAVGKLRAEIKSLPSYENTLLWYCSDNGGLKGVGSTGGRGNKGMIYEGGLRVPAMIEWPAKIKEPRVTKIPAVTSDIFPTLLEITGIDADPERPLDGISLLGVIDDEIESREEPIGFWNYPGSGFSTPSAVWMQELLEAQKKGDMVGDSALLRIEEATTIPQYSVDTLPGHAAWLDWPWKLHRIYNKDGNITWELYNLEEDFMESKDLLLAEGARVQTMKSDLEEWQRSVVRSLNGEDY